MRKPPVLIRMVLVTLVCTLVLFAGLAQPASAMTRGELRLLYAVNKARAAHGVRKVQVRSALQTGAHSWAVYLQRYNVFYHARVALGVSENIGWLSCRSGWASALVRMWLASPAHRANLLDRSARYVGVGLATGSYSRFACTKMAVTRFR